MRRLLCAALIGTIAAGLGIADTPASDRTPPPAGERVVPARGAAAPLTFGGRHALAEEILLQRRFGSVRYQRLAGAQFSRGTSPADSAAEFVVRYARTFGVEAEDLLPGQSLGDQCTRPLRYDRQTGTYGFTLVFFRQYKGGIPIYRGELRLLVRNVEDFPVVWALSSLRDLGDFELPPGIGRVPPANLGHAAARAVVPDLLNIGPPEYVIWAGLGNRAVEPRVAVQFRGARGRLHTGSYREWLFVADVATGELLHVQDLTLAFTDVTGTVNGIASEPPSAAHCTGLTETAVPYALVEIVGGNSAYTNANGVFTIAHDGTDPVTVRSWLLGEPFVVKEAGQPCYVEAQATPGVEVEFVHNPDDTEPPDDPLDDDYEFSRARVNAYVEANRVRDFILSVDPEYPVIVNQSGFQLNVNNDYPCAGSMFTVGDGGMNLNVAGPHSGGGDPENCANEAFADIVRHEYGHYVIYCAPFDGNQGVYGEGMADTIAALFSDDPDPDLGRGADADDNCNWARSADNYCQYDFELCSDCGPGGHQCGQLLSGAIWDTYEEWDPDPGELHDFYDLVLSSIPLYDGQGIRPRICDDFLFLDGDGDPESAPHRDEIIGGFDQHGLWCDGAVSGIAFYPDYTTEFGGPAGGPSFSPNCRNFKVQNLGNEVIEYEVWTDRDWLTIEADSAHGLIPPCEHAEMQVSVNDNANNLLVGLHTASVYVKYRTAECRWPLNEDPGWSTEGEWAWGQPDGTQGDPPFGYTELNVYGYNLQGAYGPNLPEYHLTTTAIDCTELSDVSLQFQRWLGVGAPGDPEGGDHAAISVSNDASNWTPVWENSTEIIDSDWQYVEYDISNVADGEETVYIRWTMGPTDDTDAYCGWNIDDVQLMTAWSDPPESRTIELYVGCGQAGTAHEWTLDSDPNWTTQGQWAWGQPTGGGGENGYADPGAGYTGDYVYGYNLAGDYPNDLSEQHLTTAAFDCSTLNDVTLEFWRWLGVEHPDYDHAYIWVSNNGSDWTQVWVNNAESTDSGWVLQQVDISSVADQQPTVYVRWTMGPTNATNRYCGWNIDDVRIVATPTLHYVKGDLKCDCAVNTFDIDAFVLALTNPTGYASAYPDCDRLAADTNQDGAVDTFDIDPFVALLTCTKGD